MEPTRGERKWRRVINTFLPPALAIIFVVFLIIQSGIIRPGGIWLKKPVSGNVITQNRIELQLSAYSFTFLPLERVEVTYWYEGINWKEWDKLCVLQPRNDKTYTCDFDFVKSKAPVGKKMLVNFHVYGALMNMGPIGHILVNYNLSPDGWGCFYWKKIDVGNPCR